MPAHPAQVVVTDPEPLPEGPAGSRTVEATVFDDDHPGVATTFRYLAIATQPLLTLGINVHSRDEKPGITNASIGASGMREMPIARWDRMAQAVAVKRLSDTMATDSETTPAEWAEALVREKFPELSKPTDGHAKRRRNSLLHLAEAAEEYARIAATGERNPAGVLAARRGTTASTVRGWLHRARREGVTRDT